ncbi:MAG: hypothetical protein IPI77_19550 [Saprospiraceae bacterium]|nr:hypothetical protein [Saprospiraceae bacterium]
MSLKHYRPSIDWNRNMTNKDPKTLESLLAEYINFVTGNAGDKAQK